MAEEAQKRSLGMVDAYIRNQTAYLQGSIVQADQKATFLLAIVGILVGYLETKQPLVDRAAALFRWQGWQSLEAGISLAAAILFVFGGCCAGAVVWPRYSKVTSRKSASFVAVSEEFKDRPDKYASDLLDADDRDILERQLKSHHYRCGVCLRKWRLLKCAYACSAAGFLALVFSFVLAVVR